MNDKTLKIINPFRDMELEEGFGIIYCIQNKVNKKAYVGQTTTKPFKRFQIHLTGQGSRYLWNAITRYGVENFDCFILEENIPESDLPVSEKYWVDFYDSFRNGYNQTSGGEWQDIDVLIAKGERISKSKKGIATTVKKGSKRSPETCRRISEAKKGKKNPMYGKPSWNKGISPSKETRRKIGEGNKGKKQPLESRKAISKGNRITWIRRRFQKALKEDKLHTMFEPFDYPMEDVDLSSYLSGQRELYFN